MNTMNKYAHIKPADFRIISRFVFCISTYCGDMIFENQRKIFPRGEARRVVKQFFSVKLLLEMTKNGRFIPNKRNIIMCKVPILHVGTQKSVSFWKHLFYNASVKM